MKHPDNQESLWQNVPLYHKNQAPSNAAAPRHAAEPRPSEYTSQSWFRHRYCIWIPPTGRAIPLIKTYNRLKSMHKDNQKCVY